MPFSSFRELNALGKRRTIFANPTNAAAGTSSFFRLTKWKARTGLFLYHVVTSFRTGAHGGTETASAWGFQVCALEMCRDTHESWLPGPLGNGTDITARVQTVW